MYKDQPVLAMRSFSTSSNRSSSSSSGGVIRNLLHRSYLRLSFKSLSLAILFAFKGLLDIFLSRFPTKVY